MAGIFDVLVNDPELDEGKFTNHQSDEAKDQLSSYMP